VTAVEEDVDLYGGVAAGVEDFAGGDGGDPAHGCSLEDGRGTANSVWRNG
jgi:hypothetical protein